MSHLDEGTLHALLDGELEVTEVKEIQAHLGSCTSCGSRLREVKEFLGESDRLVAAVQFPGSHSHPGAAAQATVAPPAPRRREIQREPPSYDGPPPPLLIPDNPDAGQLRWRWLGGLRWVALVALAVGAGYIANEFRRGGDAQSALETRELAPIASTPQDAVVSPEEAAQTGAGETSGAESTVTSREESRAATPAPAPAPAAPREEPQAPADGLE
ncbi:MAG: zf-HC2 domain-containing protein, partial [Gemmatimonadales bacterium]|nr:zf-HC2 domain-containing protein [Gemmatimonadales bacterium]